MRNIIDILNELINPDDKFGFIRELAENAPPGKKAKHFIQKHKKEFEERYGDAGEQVLYATANKLFRKKHIKEAKIALKSVSRDGMRFNVYENPTVNEMKILLDKSFEKELRGILCKNKFYVWDAHFGTHYEISRKLDEYDYTEFYLIEPGSLSNKNNELKNKYEWGNSNLIKKYPYIDNYFLPYNYSNFFFILNI